MRSTFITFLASATFLVVSASEIERDTILETESQVPAIAISKAQCFYHEIRNSDIDCDVEAILECFQAETTEPILDRIQQCLLSSDCISNDLIEYSNLWADTCGPVEEVEENQEEIKELKKRADSTTKSSTSSDASTTAGSTSASAASVTTAASTSSSTSVSASAAATTSVASSTTSDTTTTTTSGSSTLSTSTTSSTTSTTSISSNSCFSYRTDLTSACWVTTGSKTCVSSTSTASSCASKMFCSTNSAGADVCMLKDNSLTPSGVAVAIVFGTALVTFLATMITCACRDSRRASQRKRMMDARVEADAKNALLAVDMNAVSKNKGSSMGMSPLGRAGTGGSQRSYSPARSRSPVGAPLLHDGNDDTRTLLGQGSAPGSRQQSPGPRVMHQGQRSLTGMSGRGSSPSSPSRSEDGAYYEARR